MLDGDLASQKEWFLCLEMLKMVWMDSDVIGMSDRRAKKLALTFFLTEHNE